MGEISRSETSTKNARDLSADSLMKNGPQAFRDAETEKEADKEKKLPPGAKQKPESQEPAKTTSADSAEEAKNEPEAAAKSPKARREALRGSVSRSLEKTKEDAGKLVPKIKALLESAEKRADWDRFVKEHGTYDGNSRQWAHDFRDKILGEPKMNENDLRLNIMALQMALNGLDKLNGQYEFREGKQKVLNGSTRIDGLFGPYLMSALAARLSLPDKTWAAVTLKKPNVRYARAIGHLKERYGAAAGAPNVPAATTPPPAPSAAPAPAPSAPPSAPVGNTNKNPASPKESIFPKTDLSDEKRDVAEQYNRYFLKLQSRLGRDLKDPPWYVKLSPPAQLMQGEEKDYFGDAEFAGPELKKAWENLRKATEKRGAMGQSEQAKVKSEAAWQKALNEMVVAITRQREASLQRVESWEGRLPDHLMKAAPAINQWLKYKSIEDSLQMILPDALDNHAKAKKWLNAVLPGVRGPIGTPAELIALVRRKGTDKKMLELQKELDDHSDLGYGSPEKKEGVFWGHVNNAFWLVSVHEFREARGKHFLN